MRVIYDKNTLKVMVYVNDDQDIDKLITQYKNCDHTDVIGTYKITRYTAGRHRVDRENKTLILDETA